MNLISLNCSGESLEKAIVLCDTSFRTNREFYNKYEKIYIFYSDNLPKKDRRFIGMSGTISSYLNGIEFTKILNYEQKYILKSSDIIIDILFFHNFITERIYYELRKNEKRRSKVIQNIPIDYVFDTYYKILTEKVYCNYPNVEFVKISFHDILDYYITNSFYIDGHSKLYGLQADGNIATFDIGFLGKERKRTLSKRIKHSICLSPNIYTFLTAINLLTHCSEKEFIIGYRPMTRFRRPSYDLAIDELMKNNEMVVEPRNTVFSSMLDKISNFYTAEERSNMGIIAGFNCFINNS